MLKKVFEFFFPFTDATMSCTSEVWKRRKKMEKWESNDDVFVVVPGGGVNVCLCFHHVKQILIFFFTMMPVCVLRCRNNKTIIVTFLKADLCPFCFSLSLNPNVFEIRPPIYLCTLTSSLFGKYLPRFHPKVVWALHLKREDVQKSQAAGEKCQAGCFNLQQRGEVPDQAWDEQPECDRKRQRCRRQVRFNKKNLKTISNFKKVTIQAAVWGRK